jgi:hypothetical protein
MKLPIHTLWLLIATFLIQCKKDNQSVDEPIVETTEEEVITSLLVHIYRIDVLGDTVTFAFRDTDGPGGNPPSQFDTIALVANAQYACFLELLDESADPTRDITIEILEESQDHLFCYESTGIPVAFLRTDWDGQYEIGQQSVWTTSSSGVGETHIILKHQPGIKDGTCEPGETDIEVYFPLLVE